MKKIQSIIVILLSFGVAGAMADNMNAGWVTDYQGTVFPTGADYVPDYNTAIPWHSTSGMADIDYQSADGLPFSSGPDRAIADPDSELNPGYDPQDPYMTPVGDDIIPLVLMALAYVAFKEIKRRKNKSKLENNN
ncbi:MAG: hypothetical protein MJZ82_05760 [Paludibacteraceae bacterium]|nr:hypothetical protein [Paludibacteraceae bacterium]